MVWGNAYIQRLHKIKLTVATYDFKRMKEYGRFGVETWCMYVACCDKLAKVENSLMYLLVLQDLFDIIVDVRRMKTNGSKETVRAFLTLTTKNCVKKGADISEKFRKIGNAEGIRVYSIEFILRKVWRKNSWIVAYKNQHI